MLNSLAVVFDTRPRQTGSSQNPLVSDLAEDRHGMDRSQARNAEFSRRVMRSSKIWNAVKANCLQPGASPVPQLSDHRQRRGAGSPMTMVSSFSATVGRSAAPAGMSFMASR